MCEAAPGIAQWCKATPRCVVLCLCIALSIFQASWLATSLARPFAGGPTMRMLCPSCYIPHSPSFRLLCSALVVGKEKEPYLLIPVVPASSHYPADILRLLVSSPSKHSPISAIILVAAGSGVTTKLTPTSSPIVVPPSFLPDLLGRHAAGQDSV
jgi:hypothetical protein